METIWNKKARYDYEFLDTFEAGIELLGHEVKAVKGGRMNLSGSYVSPREGGLLLIGADIPPYQANNTPNGYNSKRDRRLLLTKKELHEITGKLSEGGLTMVPIKAYTHRGLVKVEIALVRPKKQHDKRAVIKERDTEREIERTLKSKR